MSELISEGQSLCLLTNATEVGILNFSGKWFQFKLQQ